MLFPLMSRVEILFYFRYYVYSMVLLVLFVLNLWFRSNHPPIVPEYVCTLQDSEVFFPPLSLVPFETSYPC